jgi:tRNA (uracil-5-)-methyltransferase TRM9
VIHHLSTRSRRVEAIASILDTLKPPVSRSSVPTAYDGGRALVYVWALEQKSSRRGWDEGDAQDIMVPWVRKTPKVVDGEKEAERTFQRYYHLYRKGELEQDVTSAGGVVLESGYEKDNWWAIVGRS